MKYKKHMQYGIVMIKLEECQLQGGPFQPFINMQVRVDFITCGVKFDKLWNLKYQISYNSEEWMEYSNSKYVYGDISVILEDIERILNNHENKILVVGLPCQIAALKAFLRREYENLVTIDLICHGVSSGEYLKQHIKYIESKHNRKASRVSFRNPEFDTDEFHFTLEDEDGIFYDKTPKEDDCYQIGYHNAIIYRQNCYQCEYSNTHRVADITVGDYWGIGRDIPFCYEKKNISLVFTNTSKGKDLLQAAVENNKVVAIERPIEESVKVQSQLNHPSKKSRQQVRFISDYDKNKFTEISMNVMRLDRICNKYKMQRELKLLRRIRNKIMGE